MTFLLLEAGNHWRLDDWREPPAEHPLAAGAALALPGAPGGPLAFDAPDGSLGRLRLPRGLALGDAAAGHPLYLLTGVERPAERSTVQRFDRRRGAFVRLPGFDRRDPVRGLRRPTAIALLGRALYVADAGRLRVFDAPTLALLAVFPLPGEAAIDLAVHAGRVYVLAGRRVYRCRPGASRLWPVLHAPAGAAPWRALLVNRAGELLLYNGGDLARYDERGRFLGRVADPGDVRDEFDLPALYTDHCQPPRFFVPPELAGPDGPRPPAVPVTPESAEWARALRREDGLFFYLDDGRRAPNETDPALIDESPRPALYAREGTWLSAPLDSRQHRCPWHTITVELDALPRGSRLELATYTADSRAGTFQLRPEQWDVAGRRVGDGRAGPIRQTFLVQGRPGRFLRLRLQLWGDGRASPLVRRLRVDFPRDSWLNDLPAEYQRNEASRHFLERFLAVAQAEWDAMEARVADFVALADPRAAPDEWLDYLASWLGLPLEGTWTPTQKRRLLVDAPAILARHGTAAGLRDYLRVYLANMTGLPTEQLGAFPVIVEGYRARRRAALPAGEALRFGLPLWSPSVVGRLQLDVFAVADEVALVATGDPRRDLFHSYAHRFRVLVPAAWVRDEAAERLLRRAIDAAKPAHTAYELALLPSRVVVGRQSTLDVDMIVGRRPPPRLGGTALGAGALPNAGADEAGRLAPGLRLGQ